MSGLLDGIKILDMGQVVAVPAAGGMLADWGAEVVKVEPLTGDSLRGARTRVGMSAKERAAEEATVNWLMQTSNKNKKSIAVDLKQQAGRDILYRLVKKFDGFMTNYEMKSVKSLGVDYDALSQHNPAIVYGILTAYGSKGPDRDERGYDYGAAWARSGIQHLIGEPGCVPPTQRGGLMDRMVGAHMAAGMLAALLHKQRTGKGEMFEVSLYQTGVWAIAGDIQNALKGVKVSPNDRLHPPNPLSNCYCSKDGHWFRLSLLQADKYFPNLCATIERPDLLTNPKFKDMDIRVKHTTEFVKILDEAFASRTMAEWKPRFQKNELTYGLVQTPEEVIHDPQAIANGFFADIPAPEGGLVKIVTPPIKFRQNPARIETLAPEIGQHTEELLLDSGYDWEQIAKLKEERVIL